MPFHCPHGREEQKNLDKAHPKSDPAAAHPVAMVKQFIIFFKRGSGLYLTEIAVKTVPLTVPLSLMLSRAGYASGFSDVWV